MQVKATQCREHSVVVPGSRSLVVVVVLVVVVIPEQIRRGPLTPWTGVAGPDRTPHCRAVLLRRCEGGAAPDQADSHVGPGGRGLRVATVRHSSR